MYLPKFKIKRNVICYDSYENRKGVIVRTNHYYKLNSLPPSIIKVLLIYNDKIKKIAISMCLGFIDL